VHDADDGNLSFLFREACVFSRGIVKQNKERDNPNYNCNDSFNDEEPTPAFAAIPTFEA
jgi:hypothetical protein